MKKIVLALAVIATVACFSSCNKKCTCKTYAAGVVVTTTEDVELDGKTYKKCSDLNQIIIETPKTGMECE
ncbi:MAG: hypothetical protein MJZ99_03050 [Bacteroidales bacterium]|nr:hypothetical protein [Candidatus Colimorpha merdihippi]MCQ2281584.1 hypothetical protein [Bacteroidales bacterium]